MEKLLRSCRANHLGPVIQDMGLSSVDDLALCEPSDLVSDLGISSDMAHSLVEQARQEALFQQRREAVQSSWKLVQDSFAVDATKLFYQHLFEEYPEVIPLFENADMEAQAAKLYKTVTLAVRYLDEVDDLVPTLQELGIRHALEWKCQREHYDIVGECLLWTLKTGMGDKNWTKQVEDAWTWLYNVIATTMSETGDAALLKQRKRAVKTSWKLVQHALELDATRLFYHHLFEEYPEVRPLFRGTDMEAQAEKLYKTVSLAVDFLDDMDGLVPKLKELGARHALEWHAKSQYYDAVGACLLWTLREGLGEAWTDQVADAWNWAYAVIATIMSDAGEEALAKQQQEIGGATSPKKKKGKVMRRMFRMAKFRPKNS